MTQQDNSEHLLRLAEQFDRAGQSLRGKAQSISTDLDDSVLTQAELNELERIQTALAFIHGVCPGGTDLIDVVEEDSRDVPRHPEGGDNTPVNVLGETPVEHSRHGSRQSTRPVPSSIGRFEIQELVGEGGFAKVYRAQDTHLNRSVALKLLRDSLFFSEDVTHRFKREAEAAAALSHPGIVPVFDAGVIDGQHFIASAFLDGVSLEQWLEKRQEAISSRGAAIWVSEIAEAIEHAHQRGVIHRDLKPANLLLIEENLVTNEEFDQTANLRIRVADFGLAKLLASPDQRQTSEGAIVGTPAYMSPEQARGDVEVDARSDIYSLGVILYELLTGEVPILGNSNIDTLLAVGNDEPVPPRRKKPSLSKDLEAICLQCLNKDPASRYSSAFALATDLQNWLDGKPVAARTATAWERAVKWTARHPGLATALTSITAALLVAVMQWQSAIASNRVAQNQLRLSQTVIDEMVNKVASDPQLPPPLRRQVAQRAVDFQEQLLADSVGDPETVAKTMLAYNRLARLLFDFSEFEAALEIVEKPISLGKTVPDSERVNGLLKSAMQVKSGILVQLKRPEESEKVIAESEKTLKQNANSRASNLFSQGLARMEAGKFQSAGEAFEAAIEAVKDQPGRFHHIGMARANLYWGRALMNLEQFDLAIAKSEQGAELLLGLLETGHGRQAVLEDHARCLLQIAEIQLRRVSQDGIEDAVKQQALGRARTELNKTIPAFQELVQANPLVDRLHGQFAYISEMRVDVEVVGGQLDAAEDCLSDFWAVVEATPEKCNYRAEIGKAYFKSVAQVLKAMSGLNQPSAATTLRKVNADRVRSWVSQFPEDQELASLQASFDSATSEGSDNEAEAKQ